MWGWKPNLTLSGAGGGTVGVRGYGSDRSGENLGMVWGIVLKFRGRRDTLELRFFSLVAC